MSTKPKRSEQRCARAIKHCSTITLPLYVNLQASMPMFYTHVNVNDDDETDDDDQAFM